MGETIMEKHKKHKKGHYIGLGIAIGLPAGIPVGLVLGNIAFGPLIGICLGLAVGVFLENRYNRDTEETDELNNGNRKLSLALFGFGVLAFVATTIFYFS